MKLLLATREGEAHFHLLHDVPGLEIVRAASPAEICGRARDIDVLYGFPSAELITAVPRLRWIQLPSAGAEFVAGIPELVQSDIAVTNTRGAHATSVAEHVFSLLLALTRGVPTCLDWQRRKHWGRSEGYGSLHEIAGSTMGIVGYGQIGRGVARLARAFSLELLAVDAHPVDGRPYVDEVWSPGRLHELLNRSDALVITAPTRPRPTTRSTRRR